MITDKNSFVGVKIHICANFRHVLHSSMKQQVNFSDLSCLKARLTHLHLATSQVTIWSKKILNSQIRGVLNNTETLESQSVILLTPQQPKVI